MHEWRVSLPATGACWFEEDPGLAFPAGRPLEIQVGKPALEFVEPVQRRRLSRLARGVFHCARRLWPGGDLPVVFASRHGESERTLGLLEELAAETEPSPTQFSLSVHNAVPGLLSILCGDRAAVTAVAAGPDSFGFGLLQAAAQHLDLGRPVLFLYGEDRLPDLWTPYAAQERPHAVALLLGAPDGGRLSLGWDPTGSGPEPASGQSLHFLAGGGDPWSGARGTWTWRLENP